jgi:nitrate reductase NapE component
MEELDLLKKDWKKNENKFPKLSEQEIYAMLHKNSTSVVKWIFLISIIEFAFFLALTLLFNDNAGTAKMESYLNGFTMTLITILDYAIMVYFFCLFYINYKKITTTDRVKNLMSNILKTRKTVSNYIFVKITFTVILSFIIFILYFNNEPEILNSRHHAEENGSIVMVYLVYFAAVVIFITAFAFVIWLFYRLIYGFLLKRLRKNYDELKKIDF